MNAIMNLKNGFEIVRAKYDSLRATVEEMKDKIAKFNPKRWKTIAIVLGIIAGILIAAALTMSIIALVKSCKNSKKLSACCGDMDWNNGFEYNFDDEDYDFSLDDHIITENDVPDDKDE